MLPLLLLLCLLAVGDVQAEKPKHVIPYDGYILPTYPALAARAFVNADYELALEIEKGAVKSIKVLSGPTDGLGKDFVANMERPIGKWHFIMDTGIWSMKVLFRTVRSNSEEGKPTYYIYRVDTGPFFSLKPEDAPSKIIIEYHLPIPELTE